MGQNVNKLGSLGTSLVVQWLKLCTSSAGGEVLIPGQGTKIPHAMWNVAGCTEQLFVDSKKSICSCLVAKLRPILCNPMDRSPPGSSVHRISQARIQERVAI